MILKTIIRRSLTANKLVLRHCSTVPVTKTNEISDKPVMVNQVLNYLNPKNDEIFIDMTFGAGGHSRAILDYNKSLKIIALDRDPTSYEYACKLAEEYPGRVKPIIGKFSELPSALKELKLTHNSIDGIFFDFGCSSMQMDSPSRGFSLSGDDGPLDMRMDQDRCPGQITAKEVLEKLDEDDIGRLLKVYGEEKRYKKIAAAIVDFRRMYGNLETTHQLRSIVGSLLDADERPTHSANKIFKALRLFVNNELNEINYGMLVAHKYLKVGGRLVTLSFDSLEDTIVKRHISGNMFNSLANKIPLKYVSSSLVYNKDDMFDLMECNWESLTQHIVLPSLMEIEDNPRSRTAALRAAVKIK